MKKFSKIFFTTITIILVTIAALLVFLSHWVFKTWANLTMEELVFQLSVPAAGTESGIIKSGILEVGVPTLLVLIFMIVIFVVTKQLRKRIILIITCICISVGVTFQTKNVVWETLAVEQYIENQKTYSNYFEDNYVDAGDVELTFPEQKRNLIYIFLESMEVTYADEANGGAFTENVIPELTQISQDNINFSGNTGLLNGGYAMTGATFTMGGMCAQTSGLPVKTGIGGNDMDTQDHFYSNMTNIGDILEENDYSNTLLIGSDATFGGRRLFFTEHGNYEIRDLQYARDVNWIEPDYYVWWGYEDQKLFSFAKETLNELSTSEEPFNLTMLTVDTHFENGYYCSLCEDLYGEQYADVMTCSSRQIAEFLQWCSEQPWYENTTIVISGDHPTMDSDFCENVSDTYTRKTYLSIINSAIQPETSTYREFTTFDLFPTTLAAMGVEIEGNRLNLGTNLFSSEQTLIERDGKDYMEQEISKNSKFMEVLSDIDYDSQSYKERYGSQSEE